jgi:hypothetical protein
MTILTCFLFGYILAADPGADGWEGGVLTGWDIVSASSLEALIITSMLQNDLRSSEDLIMHTMKVYFPDVSLEEMKRTQVRIVRHAVHPIGFHECVRGILGDGDSLTESQIKAMAELIGSKSNRYSDTEEAKTSIRVWVTYCLVPLRQGAEFCKLKSAVQRDGVTHQAWALTRAGLHRYLRDTLFNIEQQLFWDMDLTL